MYVIVLRLLIVTLARKFDFITILFLRNFITRFPTYFILIHDL